MNEYVTRPEKEKQKTGLKEQKWGTKWGRGGKECGRGGRRRYGKWADSGEGREKKGPAGRRRGWT